MVRPLIALACLALWSDAALAATPPQVWTERAKALAAEQEQLEARTSAASRAFIETGPTDLASMQNDAVAVYAAAEASSIAGGRARMLRTWLAHQQARPSAAASRAWLQQRATDLEEAIRLAALSETNLKANLAAGTITPFDSVVGLYRIVMVIGAAEGAAIELQRIGRELDAASGAPMSTESDVMPEGIAGRLRQQQTALRDWVTACNRTGGWPGCAAG